MKNKKAARPLREDVDENPCGISLNSLRARQPKVFIKTFGCRGMTLGILKKLARYE